MLNHSQELVDQHPLINCTNCGIPNPTTQQQGTYIDDGISINTLSLGHYGGFMDCIPDQTRGEVYSIGEYDSNPYLAHLCHDCTVIMLNALPGLAKFAGVHGGHPNITGGWSFTGGELSNVQNGTQVPPCCPYAWTWDQTDKSGPYNQSATYLATPELTWVKKEYEDDDLED